MGQISIKRFLFIAFLVSVICFPTGAQMTRNQLLKQYYQITKLQESGKYAEAIALCEEISAMYPKLPDPYLRMARIYDEAGEESLALLMYGQYASLEMDDEAVSEYIPRIRELEAKYNMPDKTESTSFKGEVSDTAGINVMALAMNAEQASAEVSDVQPYEETPEAEYEITASEIDTIIQQSADAAFIPSDIRDLRDIPFRAVNSVDIFKTYNTDRDLNPTSVPVKAEAMTPTYVCGKWISSLDDEDNGREYFILNLFPRGSAVEVTLDGNSGLFHQSLNIFSVSWKTIQSIWTPVSKNFDANELKDNTAIGSMKDNQFSFNFDFQKKTKTDYIKLSKNLLSFVSEFIPLGSFVSKLSDGIFSFLQEKQSTVTYQTVLRFDMKPVTDNVMSCVYTISEKQSSNGKDKEILIERKQCRFYRCPDDYEYFIHNPQYSDSPMYRSIYEKILSEAGTNIDMNFPLAYLNYYGVGTKKNLPLALGRMQTLANKASCNRARYWLASVCYNLSLDEDHYPMRATRKKFRTIAENMISDMLLSESEYVYGLQGDIYSGGDKDIKKAIPCYEQGAEKGDPYCYYQLGMAYSSGQLVERNPDKAYSSFLKAAELGYPDAYEQLAICYKNGTGVKQDYGKYVSMLYEAIERGSIGAVKELYNAYCWGAGVSYDFEKATMFKEIYYSIKDEIWKGVLKQYKFTTEALI